MGKYGWSKEEQDKILEEKKKRGNNINPAILEKEHRRIRRLEMKGRELLNNGNVSLVEGEKGYLTFEVKSLHSKERYIIHRDGLENWSGLYTFRDKKTGKKLDVMQLVKDPNKSAYIKACEMWLKEYKEV